MFQTEYTIQISCVFVVFLLWFTCSFMLRYFQYAASKKSEIMAESNEQGSITMTAEHSRFRASIAAERTLLDGFLLLAVGVMFNLVGQGNRVSGDIFSLIIMLSLFLMMVFHFTGHNGFTFWLWVVVSIALLGLYIVPFATDSEYLGYYDIVTPIVATDFD